MRTRVIVADQSEAVFYDLEGSHHELHATRRLADDKAHLHDRDFKSDRPGRVFDHGPIQHGRRGAMARHGIGADAHPRKHEASLFAHRIIDELDREQRAGEFDRLFLMAPPEFLGVLRQAMTETLRKSVIGTIAKDLKHQPPDAIRAYLPASTFHERFEL